MRELILMVDDEPQNLEILRIFLKSLNYNVVEATNGTDALSMIKSLKPDLILLDIMMPDISGYEVCKLLRESESFDSPIIFLSAKAQKEDIMQGLQLGAVDYIIKPFDLDLMEKKISIVLAHRAQMTKYQWLAYKDGLSGLYNRTYLKKVIESSTEVCNFKSIIMMDIDNFKCINDHYGHLTGDRVIIQISSIINSSLNVNEDLPFRFGGDEFLILSTKDADQCSEFARRIRDQVSLINILNDLKITVSIGVLIVRGIQSFDSMLNLADQALYHAKEHGRNQISVIH
jgi:two-component system cell cycle response regulator